ncbi:helix-turn-helix domain-containing protein [Alicyclobacillus fodiniaquatilis]|uniref:Helix-turn-helix domain-containing protein n=1 Tax=Alicyclobacillus fodiniaquatilis TaxID=1661150 RepID=A0ABW4JFD6_9BACL
MSNLIYMDKNWETDAFIHVGRLSELSPTVNFANRMKSSPGQIWGPRIIPDCQLLYVLEGSAMLYIGNEKRMLSSGDCIFYGSSNPHQIVSSHQDPFSFTSIHYNWKSASLEAVHPITGIRDCTAEDLNMPPSTYTIDVDGYGQVDFPHYCSIANLEDMFMRIVEEYRTNPYGHAVMLRALLLQLLVVIVRHHVKYTTAVGEADRIAPALAAIHQSPQENWSVQQLAALCGYHPTYFTSLFKEVTGRSPKHYQILERIQKAKDVLLQTETTQEAAEQLGYTSVHYFCRNFKAVTGLTPTQFKQQSSEV